MCWKTPSSDLGFIATYKLNKVITIDVAITNGEGPRYKQDAFGKVKIAGGLDINPSEKIHTRIFYHNRQSGIDNTATEQMISLFMGVQQSEKIRIGGEFNYMENLDVNIRNDGNSIMTGISHSPIKGINISLNYQGWFPDETA